ncbi:MAG: hypothetical protein VXW88_06655, partial [Pseudomonadota bacterium]|nr:hypothetical protein [Pseudomonadota bacterium]
MENNSYSRLFYIWTGTVIAEPLIREERKSLEKKLESTSPRKQAPTTSDFILPEKQEIFANKPLDDNDQIGLQKNVIIQQYRRKFWDQGHVIQKQGDSDPLPFLHVKDWHDPSV